MPLCSRWLCWVLASHPPCVHAWDAMLHACACSCTRHAVAWHAPLLHMRPRMGLTCRACAVNATMPALPHRRVCSSSKPARHGQLVMWRAYTHTHMPRVAVPLLAAVVLGTVVIARGARAHVIMG